MKSVKVVKLISCLVWRGCVKCIVKPVSPRCSEMLQEGCITKSKSGMNARGHRVRQASEHGLVKATLPIA